MILRNLSLRTHWVCLVYNINLDFPLSEDRIFIFVCFFLGSLYFSLPLIPKILASDLSGISRKFFFDWPCLIYNYIHPSDYFVFVFPTVL